MPIFLKPHDKQREDIDYQHDRSEDYIEQQRGNAVVVGRRNDKENNALDQHKLDRLSDNKLTERRFFSEEANAGGQYAQSRECHRAEKLVVVKLFRGSDDRSDYGACREDQRCQQKEQLDTRYVSRKNSWTRDIRNSFMVKSTFSFQGFFQLGNVFPRNNDLLS